MSTYAKLNVIAGQREVKSKILDSDTFDHSHLLGELIELMSVATRNDAMIAYLVLRLLAGHDVLDLDERVRKSLVDQLCKRSVIHLSSNVAIIP